MSTLAGLILIGLLIYAMLRAGRRSKSPSRGQTPSGSRGLTISVELGREAAKEILASRPGADPQCHSN